MTREEAQRLASGYAWGCEDSTRKPTAVRHPDSDGSFAFAREYADARERGSDMTVRDAYTRWQDTGGRTIESEADELAAIQRAEDAELSRRESSPCNR